MPIIDPVIPFAFPLGLTLVTELVFAALFGLRKAKDFAVVILVNVMTNPLLISLSLAARYFGGYVFYLCALAALEAIVFFSEGLVYRALLSRKHPFLFSLVLNAASLGLGVLISRLCF